MNKLFGGFLGFLSWFWLILSALAVCMELVWGNVSAFLVTEEGAYAGIGIVSVLLFIAYLLFKNRWKRLRRRKEVHYANAIGEISISLTAIEEALERLLDDNDIVRSHEISIYDDQTNKRLNVKARLSLWEVNNLPSKVEEIQGNLKTRFEKIMPEADSVVYNVKLASFMPSGKKKKTEKDTEDISEEQKKREENNTTDETDYFTGLKYPIESDEEDQNGDNS